MTYSPINLLKDIKTWNCLSEESQQSSNTSHWSVSDQGVQIADKDNSFAKRVQSLWNGRQDLRHVFESMQVALDKVSPQQLTETLKNPNYSTQLHDALTLLRSKIIKQTSCYLKANGCVRALYRFVTTCIFQRGVVEARSQKVLHGVDALLDMCTQPKNRVSKERVIPERVSRVSEQKNDLKLIENDFHSYSLPRDKDLRPYLIDLIEKAKESITIFMYSINDLKIMEALEKRAKNGISVKILCDKDAFEHAKRKMDSSVDVQEIACEGLMHLKILVFDNENVVFGSTNLTTGGMTKDRNLMTILKSTELANKILQKAKNYSENGSENSSKLKSNSEVFNLSQGRKIEFLFMPDKQGEQKVLNLIHTAKKTLDIAMYTWTHVEITKAVIKKHEEGVKVRVGIDGCQGGPSSTGHKVTEMLEKAGVEVILSKANKFQLLHHKYMFIDQEKVVHGSTNWTKSAFTKNWDYFAILTGLTGSDKENFTSITEDLFKAIRRSE